MKKYLIFIALCSSSCLTVPFAGRFGPEECKALFLGVLNYPVTIEQPPTLTALYKGGEYSIEPDASKVVNKRGYLQVYEHKKTTEFHLLITEYLKQPASAEIEHLQTSPYHPYTLYTLKRSSLSALDSDSPYEPRETWDVEELDNSQSERVLPDNTIIIFMNPAFIARVQPESWAATDNIIKLPTIVFHDTVQQQELLDTSAKMMCALLDFKFLHTKFTKQQRMVANNCVLSLPKMSNYA